MEDKKYKIIITIILLLSIILRIFVIEITPVNDSTQIDAEMGMPETLEDYKELYNLNNYDLEDPGHFYYIMYLYTNHKLCDNTFGQLYHPPVHYIISAIWLSVLDNFPLNSMQKVEGLQYLGLLYFIISVLLVYNLLKKINLSNESKILIILLYCFYPKFIELTTSISNDFLVYIFELLCLIFLIKWNEKSNFKNAIILALITAIGFLVKSNCVVMLAPIGICYLIKFIKNIKSKRDNSMLVLQGIIFWLIFLFLGLSYIVGCMILQGDYNIAIPLENLYIGDANIFERWSINLKECIFLDNVKTKNVWSGFLYTSLVVKNCEVTTSIGLLNLILMFLSFVCIFKNITTKEENIKLIIFTLFAQLLAYISYNIKYPYYCTVNSRYIVIAILLGIIFAGKIYNSTDNKDLKKLQYIISIAFCVFSSLSFFI